MPPNGSNSGIAASPDIPRLHPPGRAGGPEPAGTDLLDLARRHLGPIDSLPTSWRALLRDLTSALPFPPVVQEVPPPPRPETEPLYRALTEAAFEGVAVCEDGVVVDLNEHLARLLGVKRTEVLGVPFLDLVAPADHARVAEALATARLFSYEFSVVRPDDSTIAVEGRTRKTRVGSRTLDVTAVRDSTERRRAEEALLFSQERFALAMDATNDGLWDWHVPSGKGYFSPRYCSMLGYASEELLPTHATFLGLIHPDDRPGVEQRLDQYLQAGDGPFESEFRMRSRSGVWIWILSRGRIIERDSQGRPFRVMGTHSDISDRKRAEHELRESEERLRQAVRVSQIGIFDHDHTTDTLYWSPEQRLIHGWDPRAPISLAQFLALVHPEDKSRIDHAFRAARDPAGDGLFDVEYRLITHEGDVRWLANRAHTLFEGLPPDRRPVRTVGAVLDFTERKRAQERLSRARDELEVRVQERTHQLAEAKQAAEAANEAKSRFLAVMSHEIRTPLNGVTAVLHLLTREGVSPRQLRWIEMARTSAGTLLRVINDILDFSKVEAGKFDLHPKPFQLAQTIRRTVEPFAAKAAARGLPCRLILGPGLPDTVLGDADRIAQVLGNLLGNAIKFTETGSVRVNVDPIPSSGNRQLRVQFEVTDTGIGIREDQQHHLFLPFSQLDNSSIRRYGGTGLGLGICRQLVELMGGQIGVRSGHGPGATFWFVIPFELPSDPIPLPTGPQPPTPTPAIHPTPVAGHVLLAEDNDINQELLREILLDLGLTCDCVTDGAAAAHAALSGRYSLVLMDCMMPGTDGFAATRAIRDSERSTPQPRRLPIIAITANAMVGDREACLQAGMDDYLPKPIDPDQVAHVLRRWLPAPGQGRNDPAPASTPNGMP